MKLLCPNLCWKITIAVLILLLLMVLVLVTKHCLLIATFKLNIANPSYLCYNYNNANRRLFNPRVRSKYVVCPFVLVFACFAVSNIFFQLLAQILFQRINGQFRHLNSVRYISMVWQRLPKIDKTVSNKIT